VSGNYPGHPFLREAATSLVGAVGLLTHGKTHHLVHNDQRLILNDESQFSNTDTNIDGATVLNVVILKIIVL